MKVCIMQPEYSTDFSRADELFAKELELLNNCDDSMDIIVMPECADIPCLARTVEEQAVCYKKYTKRLLDEVAATARRCNAIIFVNARFPAENSQRKDLRNTTYVFNRQGEIVGHYYKQHLTPGEVAGPLALNSDYSYEYEPPTIIELEGIRFAFLTCYDFYFYEIIPAFARQNIDVIIGCCHQRSDMHSALEMMSSFYAYNCNAYVFRSSVSMDPNSEIGGASLIASPEGKILLNMKSRAGMETLDVDISKKYYKPAGFGNPDSAHYEYVEKGRRPMKYRPCGSAMVPSDINMKYPRTCAHRGFNTIAPENSMPAFGAAIAMGAEEIEFDLWVTKDGEIVSIHDAVLDRVSDGTGYVYEHTYEELLQYDFGCKHGEKYKGLKILTLEEILQKFACQTIMNIHLKTVDNYCTFDEAGLKKIIALIHKYDCEKHVYFTTGNDYVLEQLRELAPHICRCCGAGNGRWEIVERAIKYDCKKVQLFKPYFNQEMIDKAHAHGIVCNVFWSDDEKETAEFLKMGIDTILTNDYNLIAQTVEAYKKHVG